jgi:hypothetical protein
MSNSDLVAGGSLIHLAASRPARRGSMPVTQKGRNAMKTLAIVTLAPTVIH